MRHKAAKSTTDCMRSTRSDERLKDVRIVRHTRLVVRLICLQVATAGIEIDRRVRRTVIQGKAQERDRMVHWMSPGDGANAVRLQGAQ